MRNRIITAFLLALLTLSSCNGIKDEKTKSEINTEETEDQNLVLIGKRAKLIYPDFEAEVEYISPTKVHWRTTAKDGKIAESDEKISYKQLNASQFFVSWIEQDGVSVSQIVDMKDSKVTVFLTYEDESSERGKRSSQFIEGTWQVL